MKRKHILLLICLASVAVALAASLSVSTPKAAPPPEPAQAQRAMPPAPVVYSALFYHVAFVKEQADEVERQGKDASSLRSVFRKKADLSETQARTLDAIAIECVREVAAQDARAQIIINAFKERFPPGKLPAGVKLPPAPSELAQMQQERDAIIMRARDRLRLALGDQEFQSFDEFVTEHVAAAIEPVTLPSATLGSTRGDQPNNSELFTKEGGRGK
jgi:hypothetical protein